VVLGGGDPKENEGAGTEVALGEAALED